MYIHIHRNIYTYIWINMSISEDFIELLKTDPFSVGVHVYAEGASTRREDLVNQFLQQVPANSSCAFIDLEFLLTRGRNDKFLMETDLFAPMRLPKGDTVFDSENIQIGITVDKLADLVFRFIINLLASRPKLAVIHFATVNHVSVPVIKNTEWSKVDHPKHDWVLSADKTFPLGLNTQYSRSVETLTSNFVLSDHFNIVGMNGRVLGETLTTAHNNYDQIIGDRFLMPVLISNVAGRVLQKLKASNPRKSSKSSNNMSSQSSSSMQAELGEIYRRDFSVSFSGLVFENDLTPDSNMYTSSDNFTYHNTEFLYVGDVPMQLGKFLSLCDISKVGLIAEVFTDNNESVMVAMCRYARHSKENISLSSWFRMQDVSNFGRVFIHRGQNFVLDVLKIITHGIPAFLNVHDGHSEAKTSEDVFNEIMFFVTVCLVFYCTDMRNVVIGMDTTPEAFMRTFKTLNGLIKGKYQNTVSASEINEDQIRYDRVVYMTIILPLLRLSSLTSFENLVKNDALVRIADLYANGNTAECSEELKSITENLWPIYIENYVENRSVRKIVEKMRDGRNLSTNHFRTILNMVLIRNDPLFPLSNKIEHVPPEYFRVIHLLTETYNKKKYTHASNRESWGRVKNCAEILDHFKTDNVELDFFKFLKGQRTYNVFNRMKRQSFFPSDYSFEKSKKRGQYIAWYLWRLLYGWHDDVNLLEGKVKSLFDGHKIKKEKRELQEIVRLTLTGTHLFISDATAVDLELNNNVYRGGFVLRRLYGDQMAALTMFHKEWLNEFVETVKFFSCDNDGVQPSEQLAFIKIYSSFITSADKRKVWIDSNGKAHYNIENNDQNPIDFYLEGMPVKHTCDEKSEYESVYMMTTEAHEVSTISNVSIDVSPGSLRDNTNVYPYPESVNYHFLPMWPFPMISRASLDSGPESMLMMQSRRVLFFTHTTTVSGIHCAYALDSLEALKTFKPNDLIVPMMPVYYANTTIYSPTCPRVTSRDALFYMAKGTKNDHVHFENGYDHLIPYIFSRLYKVDGDAADDLENYVTLPLQWLSCSLHVNDYALPLLRHPSFVVDDATWVRLVVPTIAIYRKFMETSFDSFISWKLSLSAYQQYIVRTNADIRKLVPRQNTVDFFLLNEFFRSGQDPMKSFFASESTSFKPAIERVTVYQHKNYSATWIAAILTMNGFAFNQNGMVSSDNYHKVVKDTLFDNKQLSVLCTHLHKWFPSVKNVFVAIAKTTRHAGEGTFSFDVTLCFVDWADNIIFHYIYWCFAVMLLDILSNKALINSDVLSKSITRGFVVTTINGVQVALKFNHQVFRH